jgi:hypothetical protein
MKYSLIILVFLLIGSLMGAQETGAGVPLAIRNNSYYMESLRFANLARLAYDEGDYDGSVGYSKEAVRYAELSDAYVRLRIKMWETDQAIFAAGQRLEYAASINAATKYPEEYGAAQAAYAEARSFRSAERWDDAIYAANRVFAALIYIDGKMPEPLPAQYTVRLWQTYKDCLWDIAARPWAYNDPYKWRIIFEANKSKMPDANNPDLIEPGMVLDIPSIEGELRRGMWNPGNTYLLN